MDSNKKTVLVVEDERMMADALEQKLQGIGYNVLVARDGAQGVETALKEHPDLILLDMILPVLDGVSVLDKLREDEWGKDVPVVVLSNLSKAMPEEEIKKKGVKHYLVKANIKLSDIVDRIKEEIGTPEE